MSLPINSNSDLYKLSVKKPSLLTLIVLISFGSIGAALFTPAIPSIIDAFNTTVSTAQLTVTLYLAGYSIGQLFYSPLAKRFGRKSALYFGISVAMIASLFCALSSPFHSLPLLLFGRLVTALGSSVGLSLTFLIISDYFYAKHARKITAYTMLAFAVVPGVSIALGGLLVTYLKWESCFYFFTLYAGFALYLVYRLDETGPGKEAICFSKIVKNYRRDFKNPILLIYSILIGSTTAFVYIFAAMAPIIVISMMGIRPDAFGYLNLIPASGYFLGNFLAARLANHFETKTVLQWGIGIIGAGVLLLVTLFWSGVRNAFSLFLPVFVLYLGIPLLYSNAAVLATFRIRDKPNASSIMSFINIGIAFIGILIIEIAHESSMKAMTIVFSGIFVFILGLYICSYQLLKSDQQG